MRETWVRFLGWKDSLEKAMAIHPSILAWRVPMDTGAWATVHRAAKSWMWLKQLNTIKDDWCSFKRRDMGTHRKAGEGETGATQPEVKNIKSYQ